MPYTKKYAGIPDGFDMLRGERRSIFLSNKLWDELLKMNHASVLFLSSLGRLYWRRWSRMILTGKSIIRN